MRIHEKRLTRIQRLMIQKLFQLVSDPLNKGSVETRQEFKRHCVNCLVESDAEFERNFIKILIITGEDQEKERA